MSRYPIGLDVASAILMKVSDILRRKNRPPITVSPTATIPEAAILLCEHRIGALMVTDHRGLLGIISERDILRKVAVGRALTAVPVREVMTTEVLVLFESDDIGRAMDTMTEARVRHLPILRDGHLVGILSIGDVLKSIREEEQSALRHLEEYVWGPQVLSA